MNLFVKRLSFESTQGITKEYLLGIVKANVEGYVHSTGGDDESMWWWQKGTILHKLSNHPVFALLTGFFIVFSFSLCPVKMVLSFE